MLLATTIIFYVFISKQISNVGAIASSFVDPIVMNQNFASTMVELEKQIMITSDLISYPNTSSEASALDSSRIFNSFSLSSYELAYRDFLINDVAKISYYPEYVALSTELLYNDQDPIPVPVTSYIGAILDRMYRYQNDDITTLYSNNSDAEWLRLNQNNTLSTLYNLKDITQEVAGDQANNSQKILVAVAVLAFVSNICLVLVFFNISLIIERRRVKILSLFCKISAKSSIEEIHKFLKNNDEYTKARIQKTIDLKRVRDRIFSKYKTSASMSCLKAFAKFILIALALSTYFIWELASGNQFTNAVNLYINDINKVGLVYCQTQILYIKSYRMYNLINETVQNRSDYYTNDLEIEFNKELNYYDDLRTFLLDFGTLENQFLYKANISDFINQITGSQFCDVAFNWNYDLYDYSSFYSEISMDPAALQLLETVGTNCYLAFGGISRHGFLVSLQKVLNIIQDTASVLKSLDQNDIASVQNLTSTQDFQDFLDFSSFLGYLAFALLNIMGDNLNQVVDAQLVLQITVLVITASLITVFTIVAWFVSLAKINKRLFKIKEILNILPTHIMIGNVYIYNFLNKEAKFIS